MWCSSLTGLSDVACKGLAESSAISKVSTTSSQDTKLHSIHECFTYLPICFLANYRLSRGYTVTLDIKVFNREWAKGWTHALSCSR